MPGERNSQYPFDLAKLVASRLRATFGRCPPEGVLVRLFETLYFASLQTDEGHRPLCTVNFVERDAPEGGIAPQASASDWTAVPFESPLPLDQRALTKLARAADPESSSLNVYADQAGDLFVWGMVDQEPRHGDQIVLQADSDSRRPGLFQATITGAGRIAVHQHGILWGSLFQDVLVETNYDVLWDGPVHSLLAEHLRSYVAEYYPQLAADCGAPHPARLERELVLRWFNTLSRLLVNVQHYRHGGGLVIVPSVKLNSVHVKYRIRYARLARSVVHLVRAYLLRIQAVDSVMDAVRQDTLGKMGAALSFIREIHNEVEQRKAEVLGCVRFVAALSCVDGTVLLDKHLAVHGFGVELRAAAELDEMYLAGDTHAQPARLRQAPITQFGTRHRAMMRYCYQVAGALGFVVSQDGGIQAMMRIGERLVVWENIDVALALNAEDWAPESAQRSPVLRRLSVRSHE
ncbi:MAG: hypothetical protein A2W31_08190 [Planctomycetes bacterium RBG_16_64_10]|nr:MAG: hypothetical protein A2W31_08190 [Planctomycetes bacterium RBG_16_64_10]